MYLKVIKHAVEVDADSSRFPSDWLFHVRWGKKPGDVNGKYQEKKVTQFLIPHLSVRLLYCMPGMQWIPS